MSHTKDFPEELQSALRSERCLGLGVWNVPRKTQHVELSKLVLLKEQRKATVVDNGDIRKGNEAE